MAVEEPLFKVERRVGDCEVRDYPELVVAEVVVGGDRGQAVNRGFRLLAGYIFGGNARSAHIAMTAPVLQSPPSAEAMSVTVSANPVWSGETWVVRFTMPRGYTLDSLPKPNDQRIVLKVIQPSRFAVARFSGLTGDRDLARETLKLADFIKAQDLHPIGPASLARYDPPWTLWFLRRNELMRQVGPAAAASEDSDKHDRLG